MASPTHLWFLRIGLAVGWIGGLVGLAAGAYAWIARGEFHEAIFAGSSFALMATYPVLQEYRQITDHQAADAPGA